MSPVTTTQKLILVLVLLLRVSLPSLAQLSLAGKVLDTAQNGLPFTNVVLLQAADSSMVSGTVSDPAGSFRFENVGTGRYLIHTLMIGYQSAYTSLDIEDGQTSTPFVTIEMKEDVRQLNEIVVSGQKPLYEKQIDRTVVNVQSSVTSSGKSALEVLSKSPGVLVNRQNNSLSMYGKDGVLVMINGKASRLPANAVVQMLDGMSAANIEKIELISSPPAKYDAEGDAGMINIVMVENADFGTNGTFGLTAGHNQGPTGGGNLSLNHRRNKLNLFVDYSVLSDKNRDPWLDQRTIFGADFNHSVVSDQRRTNFTTVHNLRTGVEYELGSKTSAQVLLTGYRRNWDLEGTTHNLNKVRPDSVINTDIQLHESNIWQNASASVGLSHQLDERQSLQVSADYLYYVNDNPSSYHNTRLLNGVPAGEEVVSVTKDTPIRFKVANLDYTNQLSDRLSVEAGLKGSVSTFLNHVRVSTEAEGRRAEDGKLSDLADLDERIWAGYVSFDWGATDDLKIYGGLRYEHTDTYLSTPDEAGVVDREYGNLFPSITFSRKLSDKRKLMLAYNRRTVRPIFNDMAPFVFFTGPNSFFAGNPALRPALSDAFDLSHQFKTWWLSLKYSDTRNSIAMMQPELNFQTNEQVLRTHNMKYLRSWSVSSSLPLGITPWWEVQSNISLYYQTYATAYLKDNFTDNAFNLTLSGTSTFLLPKNFTIELSGNYQTKQLWGIWEFDPYGQLDLGIKKTLPHRQGTITLSITDLFHTVLWDTKLAFPDGQAYLRQYYDPNVQSINLTFTRSFGNSKLGAVRLKAGSEEERQRVQ